MFIFTPQEGNQYPWHFQLFPTLLLTCRHDFLQTTSLVVFHVLDLTLEQYL